MEISEKALQILNFLKKAQKKGYPPSIREILTATGIKSTASVHKYLQELQEKKYIHIEKGRNRSITLAHSLDTHIPILPHQLKKEESLDFTQYVGFVEFVYEPSRFAINASDNTMKSFGIFLGDCLIADTQFTLCKTQLVIARVEDVLLLRHCTKDGNTLSLSWDSKDKIIVDKSDIIGKVVTVLRSLV